MDEQVNILMAQLDVILITGAKFDAVKAVYDELMNDKSVVLHANVELILKRQMETHSNTLKGCYEILLSSGESLDVLIGVEPAIEQYKWAAGELDG